MHSRVHDRGLGVRLGHVLLRVVMLSQTSHRAIGQEADMVKIISPKFCTLVAVS